MHVGVEAQFGVVVDLLHKEGEDRHGSTCTLSSFHGIEVYGAVLASHPATGNQFGCETDEPTVGVILGSTGLAAHRHSEGILTAAQTHTGTFGDHFFEHINHLVGCQLADDLVRLRRKGCEYVAIIILDACYVERFGSNTTVDECGIGIGHLLHANITGSQTHADHRVYIALDTERVHEKCQLVGCEK